MIGFIILGIVLTHFLCGGICIYYFLGSKYVTKELTIFEVLVLVIFGPVLVLIYLSFLLIHKLN